jgi:hypothetical protein
MLERWIPLVAWTLGIAASGAAWWALWALFGPVPVVLAAVGTVAAGTALAALEAARPPGRRDAAIVPR